MYQLIASTRFKKDLKKIKGNTILFKAVGQTLKILKNEGISGIPTTMNPHRLRGTYKDCWECHIKPDLLKIWIQIEHSGIIKLVRVGSHSDLFK